MFYCNKCKIKKSWPESLVKSFGTCEVCGEIGDCNDKPSDLLTNDETTMKDNELTQELIASPNDLSNWDMLHQLIREGWVIDSIDDNVNFCLVGSKKYILKRYYN